MDISIYDFLQLDLMEQNRIIMDLKARYIDLREVNHIRGESSDLCYKLERKIQLFEEFQDLQLQNAIYYDEWRDKWIIKEE